MVSRTPSRQPPPIRLTPLPTRQATSGRDLPPPLTSLIGRDDVVARLAETLLAGVRLLTLTGPGGVGKTRLALAVAETVADRFDDGIAFVSLAPVRDAASFAQAIAQTLQIPPRLDANSFDAVKAALRDDHLLLVLDNFEHLIDAAPLLSDLLRACPRLTLLVTSRVRLHLTGEHAVPVPLLPLPASTSQTDLHDNPAARLFAERAAAISPGFTITDQNAATIAAICQRLDGLPLAIELAAARSNVLNPQALLSRLDQRLPILTGGPIDAPDRHRSMHDTIAWSYDLLPPVSQSLFRSLSVFVGGFTIEAAEAVGRERTAREHLALDSRLPTPDSSVLDSLTTLIEASLVQRVSGDGDEARYRMLETVREFATKQLVMSDDRDAVYGRLVDWCLSVIAEADRKVQGAEQARWFELLELEGANFKEALAWILDRGDAETALRLLNGPLWYMWSMRGWARSEHRWLERGIALAETALTRVDPHVLARAFLSDGLFFLQTGNYPIARARFEGALTLYRSLGDAGRSGIAMALGNLAVLENDQGDYVQAGERLTEALTIRRALGVQLPIAATLVNLGNVANLRGDHTAAIRLLDEALAILSEVGDPRSIAFCLTNLGEARAGLGHDAQALAYFDQALAHLRPIGDLNGQGFALVNIAASAIRLGDPARAAIALIQVLTVQRDMRNPVVLADALEITAEIAIVIGRPSVAPAVLASAARIRESAQTTPAPIARRRVERVTASARSALGRDPFETATIAGRAAATEDMVASALAFLNEFETADQPLTGQNPPTASPGPSATLSARQLDVLRLLVDGLNDPEIAATLNISTRTVETHVAGILNKLGLHSRTAAVAHAVRHRLV